MHQFLTRRVTSAGRTPRLSGRFPVPFSVVACCVQRPWACVSADRVGGASAGRQHVGRNLMSPRTRFCLVVLSGLLLVSGLALPGWSEDEKSKRPPREI